ncbi:MAG: DUF2892 domain-containing protein [Cytophagaceae bacterium]
MIQNMGSLDRMIRLMISILLSLLVITEIATGTWAIIAIVGALIMAATSFMKFCPLYVPFKIKTLKNN